MRFCLLTMKWYKEQNNIKEHVGGFLMGILNFLKNSFKQKELVLDEQHPDQWPKQLVEHLSLDSLFQEFQDQIQALIKDLNNSLKKFSDEGVLSAIPDRARTMNALHGKEYVTQVQKLLKAIQFSDLFTFEKEQATYLEANSAFKDQITKNTSVLREFMHEELKATQAILQQIEDKVLVFMKILEF